MLSEFTFARSLLSDQPSDQFNYQDKEVINNFCTRFIPNLLSSFDLVNDQNVSKNTWRTFESLTHSTLSMPVDEFLKQLSDRGADKCKIE